VLVRTWNLFHGNTVPPGRAARLPQMVRLASSDRPDVLCLQEVPLWALDRLGEWSGMQAFGEVAARAELGPLPSTPAVGRVLTSIHHGVLRSTFTGQGNAILLAPALKPLGRDVLVLNTREFRRTQARWLRLGLVARLAWAKERRICQAVRVELPDGRTAVLANLHATAYRPDERLADAELLRAAVFVDALAHAGDVCVLAGDFNVRSGRSWTLADLRGDEWGFDGGGTGVDHVLVRGARVTGVAGWPAERRSRDGLLLSDHAPLEARVE
jgi:endonuclease/exonuclease/phosphatase family metal-dependent hydrolase